MLPHEIHSLANDSADEATAWHHIPFEWICCGAARIILAKVPLLQLEVYTVILLTFTVS